MGHFCSDTVGQARVRRRRRSHHLDRHAALSGRVAARTSEYVAPKFADKTRTGQVIRRPRVHPPESHLLYVIAAIFLRILALEHGKRYLFQMRSSGEHDKTVVWTTLDAVHAHVGGPLSSSKTEASPTVPPNHICYLQYSTR